MATAEIDAFQLLLKEHPWPRSRPLSYVEPFSWSLDGGGRHLIQKIIESRPNATLLEIGSFMGGSALQFLQYSESLRMVLCDPWSYHLTLYANSLVHRKWAIQAYGMSKLLGYASLLNQYDPFLLVQNNLYEYRQRCVLIKQPVPRAYWTCVMADLKPDIVYIDARKQRKEFWDAHHAFPNAILCGDDWSWRRRQCDSFRVREFVNEIAAERNASVYADRMTFVIHEKRHDINLDSRYEFIQPS